MPSLRSIFIFALSVIFVAAWWGCGGDDKPTEPEPQTAPAAPINIFGAPLNIAENIGMLLVWTDTTGGTSGTYNIYRTIAGNAAEKLNTSPWSAASFGPGSYYPKVLWYVDSTYDTASTATYVYYLKAVNDIGESGPSDSVVCVPHDVPVGSAASAGQVPDQIETSVNPSFEWNAHGGASSYMLMLSNEETYHDYWTWWLYRTTATGCQFHDPSGKTYLFSGEDTLQIAHNYAWMIWAVNADNCGIARAEATFKTYDPDFYLTFVNGSQSAGVYRICWNQTNLNGLQVMPGAYQAHITAGDYNLIVPFYIVAPGTPVSPAEVLDCDEDFSGLLPKVYSFTLNADSFLVGDTIKMTYLLPVVSNVNIEIDR